MEPAPHLLRKGAIINAPAEPTLGTELSGTVYIDLLFIDGHVERWVGPGRCEPTDPDADALQQAHELGDSLVLEQGQCLLEELSSEFSDVRRDALDSVPVEIVMRWL